MKELALRQFNLFICLILMLFNIFVVDVQARTIEEINADKEKNEQEIAKVKAELDRVTKELQKTQSDKNSSLSEINKVKNEIAGIESQSELLKLQKQMLENELLSKSLEKEEKEKLQDEQIVSTYISWKSDDSMSTFLGSTGDIIKNMLYFDFMTKETVLGVKTLAGEIDTLNQQSVEYENQAKELEQELVALDQKKTFWEEQIRLADEALASVKSTQSQLSSVNSQLEEQQKYFNAELEQAVAAANSGSKPLVSGEIYFFGSVGLPRNTIECTGSFKYYGINPGTDAFGHGLGMSQWGAYGAANKGWSSDSILKHYYQGTTIETREPKMITVNGVGKMSMEDYVSGLGEVPDKACGTMEQIEAWTAYADAQGWASNDPKRDKYRLSGCWPEEAIKAQIIAARTYAYNRTNSICTSDSCQVYDQSGPFDKAWAAWETKDKVILSGGNVIDAFYSGYNSNGWGSANIETVWTKSSPRSYLTAVKDIDFTYTPRLCNQDYRRLNFRTNSYSIEVLRSMLQWGQERSNWPDQSNVESYSWNADVVRYQINSKIGTLTEMGVENDASGRANKVVFKGTNGEARVSGIFFRMLFNTWAGRTFKDDGIKGITFDVAVAQ